MRIGFNPNKDRELEKSDFFHQIIIPVHIPNQEDYFRNSLKILQYSLESIFKTVNNQTFITVVNNGCCNDVVDYLNILHSLGKIHELIHTSAIGKLNAIFKGLSGHQFSLITITDADVLFLRAWQEETYRIFENFPKAGAVCPVPSSKSYNYYTSNILATNIFSKSLKFTTVKNPDALRAFASSIGNKEFYKRIHLEKYMTLERNKVRAVIGAGHFLCTYRGEVFWDRNSNYSNFSMGGESEREFLDQAVENRDLWRLSTEDNFAYHMGNVSEEWMDQALSKLKFSKSDERRSVKLFDLDKSNVFSRTRNIIIGKMSKNGRAKKLFLLYKGLTKESIEIY